MRKYILISLFLVVFSKCSYASDTNQTVTVPAPANNEADYSTQALSLLMASSGAVPVSHGNATSGVVSNNVSTNKPVWEGTVALGLTATAGNVNSALVTGNFRAHRKTPRDEWTLAADAAYGEVSSVKNAETLHGVVQYNHLFDERWYGYANTEALHDAIADVVYRFTFSPGVGYYLVKEKETSLAVEAGPAVLTEKLDDEYHTYPVARLAERFEHKFDAHARLWQNVEILPPVNDPPGFLVNAEIGVETPLTKLLSLQTYVDDNYANRPAPGFKDNDVKVVSGLAIKF